MPYAHPATLAHLSQLLRQRLTVTNIGNAPFAAGPAIQDEIVTTNRLILVVKGEMHYTMEGRTQRWKTGVQFFVPAWARRAWRVPQRRAAEIIWYEFDDDGLDSSAFGFHWRVPTMTAFRKELAHHTEMLDLWKRTSGRRREADVLCLEGEIKAMLARFWTEASPLAADFGKAKVKPAPVHRHVKTALRWLRDHFHEADALEGLYRATAVTPNDFRRHFHVALKCTPQEYLQRLRMRRARYLLHETDLLHKQIAMEVGYADAHYFSRLYSRFWGHSPRRERKES